MPTHGGDGGPAFPRTTEHFSDEYCEPKEVNGYNGMSVRDWFAGQALSLFYWQRPEPKGDESGQSVIARMAYSVADAMIKARNGGDDDN